MIQETNPKKKDILRWLASQARSARRWIALSVALGLAGSGPLIVQAYCIAHIVHGTCMSGLGARETAPLFWGLGAAVIARAVLSWLREAAGFRAGAKVRETVRLSIMTHLIAPGPAFMDRRHTGALAAVAMEQVESLHNFFSHYLPQMVLAVAVPLTILAVVFPVSWAAGGLLMMSAPMIPIFMILVGMGAENISRRHFKALARMSAHFLDILQGLPTLKLFNRSRDEKQNIARISTEFRQRTMAVLRIAFVSSAVLEFFSALSIALTAVFLGMRYLGYVDFGTYGEPLTLAGGLFILLLAPEFYMPLRELGTHYHARADAVGAAEAILALLQRPLPRRNARASAFQSNAPIRIECHDLHLAYDNGRRHALTGINLILAPGEKIAVVGASGAGKTTLLHLILGFLSPDRGDIRINGRSLRDIPLENWYRHVAWIGQQPVLFHGTIRENIRMGRPGASDEEIQLAAKGARVLEFTDRMPMGLEMPVGERGAGISRGQAQRVALARAILKDAPVWIMDEPTAGLDPDNERMVMATLERLTEMRTVLMATHRIAALKKTDQIIVMAGGRIVEKGSYAGLTALNGSFERFVRETGQEDRS
ncbi:MULTISPECIES: heme ABC transporter permease/ATP-binding protein CydD [Desulfococcus]|jgi:ATP-binding cassette subfamily C protein CydD|uniref:ABC transporter, CydDC cysteine exporter (CydDC-E) family, permease/ATP-binding protein CydD n=1 Tax=Desulfococcus multivorans DSM 2059 TaxID=1121405 RepID=S7TW84_DESML|nr:cysteine/glutathione ABC transporter permease/ATP-binding protein CydD [Desulfococcus multivorans]AOY58152.1 CydD: ABC transporter, ATP-binding/permease protein [Desulfococcus multivorans]EPR41281.1 ABC transporter, CydDC cysteine exporter (CydDC-E) family, permease/ATP-binding protein CydD [Desulfococcus multivorans DSM 2059]MDX9817809.1 cysteine/glutathione ABC transporter permease/ATP-binding protein CydD [Desulfococcus multivorans]SJZ74007.1 ATP-binding cassette, subfamily C, CydD [Desul